MKLCLGILALLALCSCSPKYKDPPRAQQPPQKNPNPQCGPGPQSAPLRPACLPQLPPLSAAQKQIVFRSLRSEALNEGAVAAFDQAKPVESPELAQLIELLKAGKCLRSVEQDPDGRSLSRVQGESCPIHAQSSFRNVGTPKGSREEESSAIEVLSEGYGEQARLTKLSKASAVDSVVTERAPRLYNIDLTGIERGAVKLPGADPEMSYSTDSGGQGLVDFSQGEMRLLSLSTFTERLMHFPGFEAGLRITLQIREDGSSTLRAWLNGEEVPVAPGKALGLRRHFERLTLRSAAAGI